MTWMNFLLRKLIGGSGKTASAANPAANMHPPGSRFPMIATASHRPAHDRYVTRKAILDGIAEFEKPAIHTRFTGVLAVNDGPVHL